MPVIDFDPLDPSFRHAPHAVYQRLREEDPVHRSSAGYWVCTRYDDVSALLTDPRFSNQVRGASPPDSGEPILDLTRHWFNFYDPPQHTRVRRLVSRFFTPRHVESLRATAEAVAHALLHEVADADTMDIVTDFAYPLPILVMAELLGVPGDDRRMLRPWLRDLHAAFDLAPGPDTIARGRSAVLALLEYFSRLAATASRDRPDTIIARLAAAEGTPDGVTAAELPATCILLLFAGYETTTNLISAGLAALLTAPSAAHQLWAGQQRLDLAINEMLRFTSPTQFVMRRAVEDVELRGRRIPEGALLRLILAAANRDPAVFDAPDELVITRDPNPHLALGAGMHVCIGGPLSRLNATVAFEQLIARFARLERDGAGRRADNVSLPSYESLPVRLTRR